MEVRINYYEKYPMQLVEKRRRFVLELVENTPFRKKIKSITRKTHNAVYEIAKKWVKQEKAKGNIVYYDLGALALEDVL